MKKVMKKFNRALSIMLVAAMVLTMAPQTAMPVLAAEPEVEGQADVQPTDSTPAGDTTTNVDVEPSTDEDDTTTDTPADVTETDKVPETEQKEVTEGDEVTPVIETDVTDEEPSVKNDAENVPEVADKEATEKTPEETPEDDEIQSADINAVADTASVITVVYANDPTTDTATNTAEVVFLGGCVSSENKLAKDRALKFRVEPAAGRSLVKVEVKAVDGETETEVSKTEADGVYTVANTAFIKGSGADATALNGKIIVTTKAVNYKVSFAAAEGGLAASTYAIYPVVPKAEGSNDKALDTAVSAAVDVAYGKSADFAIELTGDPVVNKLESITLDGSPVTVSTTAVEMAEKANAENKHNVYTFSVDPSKAESLKDATKDTAAAVNVKVVAKAKLTVAFDAKNANSTAAASATNIAADKFINYDGSKFGTDSTFVEDDATNLAKSLAFKVTPVANYKITSVTAKATPAADAEGKDVTVTAGTPAAADGSVECTIALNQESLKDFSVGTTLTISIATELDTAKDDVHTINFKNTAGSAPAHVTIGHGASDTSATLDAEKTSLPVTGDTYKILIDPDDGYVLPVGGENDKDGNDATLEDKPYVTITETRKYESATETGTYNDTKTYTHKEDASAAITLTLADKTTGDTNYADGATDERTFITTSVDVVIDTSVEKNDGEKIVKFTDSLGAGYKITTEGVIHDEEAADAENTYVVPETVDELTFTVTSARVPAVTANGKTYEGTAAENVYTFTIPAMALNSAAATEIKIAAKTALTEKDVKVKVNAADVSVQDEEDTPLLEDATPDDDGYYTLDPVTEGDDLTLNFYPAPGVKIVKVSYAMGETKKDVAPDRRGNVKLTLTVTDALTIDVESKSDYSVVLRDNEGNELAKDGDAYVADYTDTNISIGLVKAGEPYADNLYNVVVKDGAKTAATEATVSGATAAIAKFDETEYGKDLTIEVYINKTTSYKTTLKTNVVSDAVTVSRVVKGKDTKVAEDAAVEIMPDARMAFTVTPAKGASLSDLDVEILAKDGSALTAANTPVEASAFADGVLTVTTKADAAKDTEVLVSIFNKNAKKDGQADKTALKGGKFVLKLTDPLVKTAEIKKVTAVAGSATNRAVRLNVSVEFKDKKNLPAMPIQGDLYYKVEFAAPTGAPATGVTVAAATTLYKKITDYENTADTITFDLVTAATGDDLTTDPAVLKDIAETIATTAKVTLVQSKSTKDLATETVADTDYVAGPAANDCALQTKPPVYETKLTVKNVNGATVITGQSNVKVATPVFGKTTGYDEIDVEFVDSKSGVSYGQSFGGYDDDAFTTTVGADNSILVSIDSSVRVNDSAYKTLLKTLGVKVTAVGPDDSYRASAVVKLKVKQGIFDVDVDESKAALPYTLFKDPAKKNSKASVKITPMLNWGNKNYKPAKSAVTWEIAPATGNTSTYAAAAVTGKKPLVSVKNGTVSVAAGYQVQPEEIDNTFTVTIRANDFEGNGYTYSTYATRDFEITDERTEIERLVVLDAAGDVVDPASLTAEDFDYWNHATNDYTDDTSKYLYVKAIKKGEKELNHYDLDGYGWNDAFLPVTYKSGNAKALAVDAASGLLTFSKPADRIKITATTVDGGKAAKKDLTINVKPYNKVGLMFVDEEEHRTGLAQDQISYTGGSNKRYSLYPHYATENGWNGISDYKNLKITVKGGKFIANKNWAKNRGNYMGYAVVVTDKSGKATVTITDTGNKNKKTEYTITNNSNKVTVKAPSIKLYNPKKVTNTTDEITWQVTDKNNDNYAGQYVKLTPDFTVTASNMASRYVGTQGKILKIDENGRFTLNTPYMSGGAYKMIATVGTMTGGEFAAAAKDVKLSFSLPVKKYKTTLNVKGSYTLDAKSASYAVIDVKSDYNYEIFEAMNVIKKTQGKDDHTNRFTEFFEVVRHEDEDTGAYLYTIGLKEGLTDAQLTHITTNEGKDDRTGYIKVTNYNYNGALNTKYVQLKISFKANTKYSLTGATIFSNGTATTPITATVRLMNGKNRAYIAKVWRAAADDGKFIGATPAADAITFNDDGDMVIKSQAAAIAPGKYEVKLIVVTQDSGYLKWVEDETPAGGHWVVANDKAEGGTPLTDAQLVEKAGIPVTAKIDVKAVDTRSIAKAKSLNVTLSTKSCDTWNNNGTPTPYGNGYVQATSTASGYYQVDVPYSIATVGSDIAADGVKVNLTKKSGETTVDQNKITVATGVTEDLVKATKAIGFDADDNPIPVIRLQVSKKALVALTAMKPADKPITAYGKKLKVPVEIKYTNGITTTDTLNFNITMPKKAPDDFATVQKTITDNKTAIEKIQTKLSSTAQLELTRLIGDVAAKVNSLIPADTDVRVGYTLTKKYLNDGEALAQGTEADALNDTDYTDIMDAGKAKITLTLTDVSKAADNTTDVSWNYTLGMNAKSNDVSSLVSVIQSLSLTYTNATTADKLLDEIKADNTVKPYLDARKGHLSLKVSKFEKTPATTKAPGKITAWIQVKDLVTNSKTDAKLTDKQIAQLSTLTGAKANVAELFNTDVKVQAYVDKCSGQEAVMKEAILKAAGVAAGNDDITIAFKADTTAKKGWDYTPAKAAVTEGETTTPATNGSLKFTLVLTKKQADGSRSMEVSVTLATIDAANAAKYVSLTDAKTKIAAEVADGATYTKLKAIVANAATANDAAAIKTAIKNKMDSEVANYKGYTLAWAKKADGTTDDFDYTPATQSTKGKLSFKMELTLTGAKDAGMTTGVTETISVENVEVVDEADKYQTAEELQAKIKDLGTAAKPITGATVPTGANDAAALAAAKTALETAIATVNKTTPAITVTVENVAAADGVTATTYTTTPTGEGVTPTKGEYKNVKITIGTGADKIEFTHDFVFAVQVSD